jgi:hypothetical protein
MEEACREWPDEDPCRSVTSKARIPFRAFQISATLSHTRADPQYLGYRKKDRSDSLNQGPGQDECVTSDLTERVDVKSQHLLLPSHVVYSDQARVSTREVGEEKSAPLTLIQGKHRSIRVWT